MTTMKKTITLLLATLTLGACTYHRPIAATSNPVGTKTGRSTQTVFLGMAFGDGTIEGAVRNGGLTRISFVDFRNTNILYIYQRHTCVVNGE